MEAASAKNSQVSCIFLTGEKMNYDPSWKGPSRKRSCTDCFWLIIFIIFLSVWSFVAYYALTEGNIEKLIQPTDSEGRKCGIDSQVKDKRYLLFFDLTKCAQISSSIKYRTTCPTTQVCVSKCPSDNFLFDRDDSIENLKKNLICKIDVKVESLRRIEDIETLINHERCAKWYLKSTPIFRRCFPVGIWDKFVNQTITNPQLEKARDVVESVARLEDVLRKAYDDMDETKYVVLAIAIGSGFVSLLYIVILRWLAGPCVWLTILTVSAALGYATYESTVRYLHNRDDTEWLVLLIVSATLLTLILLSALFLRKRIYLACQLIKESSKAVTSILSSLFFPVVPWVLHLLVLTYGVAIFLYLLTIWEPTYRVEMMGDDCYCKTYKNNSLCHPDQFNRDCYRQSSREPCILSGCNFMNKTRPWFINYFHAINIVGFYWLFFFVSAFGEMVLAATFATWYWTLNKRQVPYFTITVGFWRTVRYHLGTLAFGALILTICRIIRLMLEWLNKKVKRANNECANGIMCCCRCFFYLLENFLRFINNNAYVMCAVHGKGFCRSARDAFNLLMRNVVRVVVINKITSWLLLLGKLLITGLTVTFTWWFYTGSGYQGKEDVNFWATPVIMTAIASFLIATVFFKVHAAAIDTLFLCFLEDCERNDGTKERPYYMSKRLRKLLHK